MVALEMPYMTTMKLADLQWLLEGLNVAEKLVGG
jgi:hypothetical protein